MILLPLLVPGLALFAAGLALLRHSSKPAPKSRRVSLAVRQLRGEA